MDDVTKMQEAFQNAPAADPLGDAKATVEAAIAKAVGEDDPGAVFESEAIKALRLIRDHSRAEFIRLRAKVKRAHQGVLITELDREVKGSGESAEEQTLAASIIALVQEAATLFHDREDNCYASFAQNGHIETWPLESQGFAKWCSYRAYTELDATPSDTILSTATRGLSGIAIHDGEEHEVFLRVAKRDDRYYLDLCNEAWQAVEITATGWQVLDNPPVKFRRTKAMQPLPMPGKDGDIDLLWQSVNVPELERPLIKAWLLETWRLGTPFPIIEVGGQQGSGKSDTQSRLRDLIDPNRVNLRAAPKAVEDIYVNAGNSWVVSFNNLSHLSASQQDAFCTLSTGGGFGTRTLYTNDDETVIECQRPVIFNGISTLATAQDLVDRLIKLELPPIKIRKRDAELRAEFERNQPRIFSGLLDLFVKTLAKLSSIALADYPRMADFASLGEAMMQAEDHPPGTFMILYRDNQERAVLLALESSPVACAVQEFMDRNPGGYNGLIKNFKDLLEGYRTEAEGWPRSAKGLADALRRHAPGLKILGIRVWLDPQRRKDGYHVTVKKTETLFSGIFKTENQSAPSTSGTPTGGKTTDSGGKGVLGVHDALRNPILEKAEKKVSPTAGDLHPGGLRDKPTQPCGCGSHHFWYDGFHFHGWKCAQCHPNVSDRLPTPVIPVAGPQSNGGILPEYEMCAHLAADGDEGEVF